MPAAIARWDENIVNRTHHVSAQDPCLKHRTPSPIFLQYLLRMLKNIVHGKKDRSAGESSELNKNALEIPFGEVVVNIVVLPVVMVPFSLASTSGALEDVDYA